MSADGTETSVPTKVGLTPGDRPIFYKDIELAQSADNPRRLVFIAAEGAPSPPDDLLSLRQEYERTARVASVLFEGEVGLRKEIFQLMHEAADRGMRGPSFNIADGQANLVEVRETILDYAHNVRDNRLRDYTRLLVIFGIISLIIGAVVLGTGAFGWLNRPTGVVPYDPLFLWIIAAFWIPAGAAVCVWGEFALRMQAGLTYEQLLTLDPSRWRPGQRLLVTVGVSFIFAFLLAYNAVQVGLGGLLLNDFATKTPAMALAVGGVTGLAFAAVQDIIFRIKPTVK
jgi:hypothetical protein